MTDYQKHIKESSYPILELAKAVEQLAKKAKIDFLKEDEPKEEKDQEESTS